MQVGLLVVEKKAPTHVGTTDFLAPFETPHPVTAQSATATNKKQEW
jgi:hypothetical protein